MKLIIKSLLVVTFITFISCKNQLDKSVIEPMEIENLKTIIEKDTLFEYTYKAIQEIRETVLTDDVEKAKWSDITYNRVHKMMMFYQDSLTQSKYTNEIQKEWKNKYGIYDEKVDSITKYWEKYKKENSLDNYVKIELFDIQTTENNSVKVGFKISPNNCEINNLMFDYVFIKKNNQKEISEWERYSSLNDNTNEVFMFRNSFNKSKIYWDTNIKNEQSFKNKILEDVLNQYVFKIEISSLKKNGIRLSKYDLKIPRNIESLIENNDDFMKDYYEEDVIKEFLNNDYICFRDYKRPFIDSIAKSLDAKVLKFFELKKKEKY